MIFSPASRFIQTPRLTITPSTPDDCADFMALERDAQVMRFLNGGHPVDRANATGEESFSMPMGTEPEVWTARLNTSHIFVGWFGLWPDENKAAELGYRLARSFWGQGYASEGAGALIDWGFHSANLAEISANTMAVNVGSRRVMEKIDMTQTRAYASEWLEDIDGKEFGDVEYAITKQVWQKRSSGKL